MSDSPRRPPSIELRAGPGHEGCRRVRFAHRSVSEYLPQRTQRAQRKEIDFRTWRPWRLGARHIRIRGDFRRLENLRKPRKLSWIVVHAFSQTALGKRGSP